MKPDFELIERLEKGRAVTMSFSDDSEYSFLFVPIVEGVRAYRVYVVNENEDKELAFYRGSDKKLIVRKCYAKRLPSPFLKLDDAIHGRTPYEIQCLPPQERR